MSSFLKKGQRSARRLAGVLSFAKFDYKSLKKPKNLIRILFWAVIYIFGSILTLLSCIDLYRQWQQNPISSSVANINNKTITSPDPTICLPFYNYQALINYLMTGDSNKTEFCWEALNAFPSWQEMQNTQWQDLIQNLTSGALDQTEFYLDALHLFSTWQKMQNTEWQRLIINLLGEELYVDAQNFFSTFQKRQNRTWQALINHMMTGDLNQTVFYADAMNSFSSWQKKQNTAWQALINNLTSGEANQTEFYVDALNSFLSWQEMKNSAWPAAIIVLTQAYMNILYEIEGMRGYEDNLFNYTQNTNDSTYQVMWRVLVPKLSEWKVTIGQFKNVFGRKFLEFYSMTVTLYSTVLGGNQTRLLNNQEMVYASQQKVCYKLNFEGVQLDLSSRITININNANMTGGVALNYDYEFAPQVFRKLGPKIIFASKEPVTVDIPGQPTVTILFGKWVQLVINPEIEYLSLPAIRGSARCSVDTTQNECENKCRQKIVEVLCKCTPAKETVSLDFIIAGEGCQFGQLEKCLLNFTGTEDSNCMNGCLDSCVNWQFVTEINQDIITFPFLLWKEQSVRNQAVIDISVTNLDYIFCEETDNWTTEVIVGTIGGAFGFWLGLDMLTIAYMILSKTVLFLIGKCIPQKTTVEELNPNSFMQESDRKTQLLQKIFPKDWKIETWTYKDPEIWIWIAKKLIWTCLFVAGAALTIKMFINLCITYKAGGTVSISSVMINKTMVLPSSVVCTTFSEATFSPSGDYANLSFLFNESNFEQMMIVNELNKTTLLSPDWTWPRFLIYMISAYLRAVSLLEQGSTYEPMDQRVDESAMLNYTRELLIKYSITEEELNRKFAIEFAHLRNINVQCFSIFENKTFYMTPLSASYVTSPLKFNEDQAVCIYYPIETFTFHSFDDSCVISASMDSNYMYWATKSGTSALNFSATTNHLNGKNNSPLRTNVTFDYSAIYQSLNTTSNCSMDNTPPIDCVAKCRSNLAAKYCNCQIATNVTTDELFDEKILQCDWQKFSNCLTTVANMMESCYDNCTPACTHPTFLLNSSTSEANDWQDIIEIRIFNFVYPLFTEQLIMMQSDFLAASGGLLGFYLGLDMTFFVSIIFTPLMLLTGLCIPNAEATIEENILEEQTNMTEHRFWRQIIEKLFNIDFSRQPLGIIVKSLFEGLVWAVVYLAFSAFTLLMCLSCYQQMKDNPTSSSFDLFLNKTITIPTTTFCVPLDTSVFDEQSTTNTTLAMEHLFKSEFNFTKQSLLDTAFIWPLKLLQITQQYLGLVDNYRFMDEVDIGTIWSAFKNDSAKKKLMASNAIDIFAQKIGNLNITREELLGKFGQELQQIYAISVNKYDTRSTKRLINSIPTERITLVATSEICYELPVGAISFSSQYEFIHLDFKLVPQMPLKVSMECSPSNQISMDLPGRVTGATTTNFLLTGSMKSQTTTFLDINTILQILPMIDGVQRCSETKTSAMCMEDCEIKAVETQCGCTPEGAKTSNNNNEFNAR